MARTFGTQDFCDTLLIITDEMIAQKLILTEIDGKLGDGDMGISMEKAALAIRGAAEEGKSARPGQLLMQCAMACNKAAPSTLGTLLSVGMMAIAKELGQAETADEACVAGIPAVFAQAMALRGKAKEGDKTILDALWPYARVMRKTFDETGDLHTASVRAADAAEAGMESTKGKPAKIGRAKWLAERHMDCPDGGAVLCACVARRLAERES